MDQSTLSDGRALTPRAAAERPAPSPRPACLRSAERWGDWWLEHAPRTIARVAILLGVISLVEALWPHHWRLLSALNPVLPVPARATADALVAVSALLLLRIAAGLRKRKQTEWRIAVIATFLLSSSALLRAERRPVEAVAAAVLLVALLSARSRFTAHADPQGPWFAARVGSQFFAAAVAYGMLALSLPGHLPAGTSLAARLREVLLSLAGMGGSLPIAHERFADTFHATLLAFGLLTITTLLVLLVRPAEPAASLSPADEARLRSILDRHGERDSLGYFALRRDKSVVWSPTGKAGVTYRVVFGVALASGDPVGDPEAWPGAIEAYRKLVERFGWTPAVMGCSELGAIVFKREYGLSALELGDEAVVSVDGFSLQGRSMRGVRQACTRVARAGYTVDVRRISDLAAAEIGELRKAADSWRGDAVERGFSMALSRLGDAGDPDCVVVTARQNGALRGLLHFVPWSTNGISLDLMRRDRSSDNGLNEFMIAELIEACPTLGIERMSLNFAVFRDALERGGQIGAGPVLRLWRRLLLVASRWWQIESLYRFNAKFQPTWQPRFVCYPAGRDLPRIALAALDAEAFIVRPRVVKRLLGRTVAEPLGSAGHIGSRTQPPGRSAASRPGRRPVAGRAGVPDARNDHHRGDDDQQDGRRPPGQLVQGHHGRSTRHSVRREMRMNRRGQVDSSEAGDDAEPRPPGTRHPGLHSVRDVLTGRRLPADLRGERPIRSSQ